MQVQLSEDFYRQIKFKHYIGDYAVKHNLLIKEEILGLNKDKMERKLSESDKFNNLKDFIKDVEASYYIGSLDENNDLEESNIRNTFDSENENFHLNIESNGSLVLRSKDNTILIDPDVIICLD